MAVVHSGKIFVANTGDSRSIIVQKGGKSKEMSHDHKPQRDDEARRINSLPGGRIIYYGRWRVQGVLAVSRAIGDVGLKPYVIADPEVLEATIGPDDIYLVLATDGLWDVMKNEEVARFVANCPDFSSVAKELCYEAKMLGSTDNVTCLVVNLHSSSNKKGKEIKQPY